MFSIHIQPMGGAVVAQGDGRELVASFRDCDCADAATRGRDALSWQEAGRLLREQPDLHTCGKEVVA